MYEMNANGDMCRHKDSITLFRRLILLERGSAKCQTCGEYVRFSGYQVVVANIFLIACLGAAIVLSVKYKTWLPYLIVGTAYVSGRWVVLRYGVLTKAEKSSGLSILWFVCLVVLVVLLMKFL